jgi:hypothetical protein
VSKMIRGVALCASLGHRVPRQFCYMCHKTRTHDAARNRYTTAKLLPVEGGAFSERFHLRMDSGSDMKNC